MSDRQLTRFAIILDMAIAASGSRVRDILTAIGETPTYKKTEAIDCWRRGKTSPRKGTYVRILRAIESHLGLPEGRLANIVRGRSSALFDEVKSAHPERLQIMRWHLPKDFDTRSEKEKCEILAWISDNVFPCNTEYGRYQSVVSRDKFAIVFPKLSRDEGGRGWMGDLKRKRAGSPTIPASPRLTQEMRDLVHFKTVMLPPKGYVRGKKWLNSTAVVQVARYGLALGTLAAERDGDVCGLGVPVKDLTLGLFAFPEVWEWYLSWYQRRRGFFSSSEQNLLYEVKSLTRNPSGWVRQHAELAQRVRPIEGLVSKEDIAWTRSHWDAACDRTFDYAQQRSRDIRPMARMHRDPFIAIMPVLNAKSPLKVYKKIGDEVLKHMPDPQIRPMRAAVAIRGYLAFRLAIHTGLRQRNLRELLLCRPGKKYTEVRDLETIRRGELRWDRDKETWNIFAPAVAIKNGGSSFFRWRPFQMSLPDLEGLYGWIDAYIRIHRSILLNGCRDPGTFFVRTMMDTRGDTEVDIHSFYNYWKDMTHRYGIYNPYTKRGAVKGLLPHGPHCVRDVLATHLLKTTGSYELASFAIQDSLESVMRHYTRFLPHEKIARAAEEVNKVWRH